MTQLAAVIIGLAPMYGIAIWSGIIVLNQPGRQVFTVTGTLLNTLVTVGAFGGLIVLVLWFLCGERLRDLQLARGDWITDIYSGAALAMILYLVQIAFLFFMSLVDTQEYSPALVELGKALAAQPLLLAAWLLPVAWLQGGLLEEFARVFMLSRLWRVYSSPTGRYLVLLASALIFGLGHIYQGYAGILGTMLLGLVLGWHYMRYSRVLPIIIGHALYDTLVMIQLAAYFGLGPVD